MSEPPTPLPFATRLWFAWMCFFRVLFDGEFAARAWVAREPARLPASPASAAPKPADPKPAEPPKAPAPPDGSAALQLLSILQREGRLVDFLEQDVASFSDADVGAAARVVHEGCRKALRAHVTVSPVRDEEEGASVELPAGFDAQRVKLTGNVQGKGPYRGKIVHRGWRAAEIKLPTLVAGHDPRILAAAEVEI